MSVPVLLVLLRGGDARWLEPLGGHGMAAVAVTGHEAIHAVRQSSAQWVAFERVPGWQAVARGVFDAGGRPVLLGVPATPAEQRWLEGAEVPAAQTPAALVALLSASEEAPAERRVLLEEEAEALSHFAEAITAQPDLETVGQVICARIREACAADQAILFLVDPLSGSLEVQAPYPGAADRAHRKLAETSALSAQPWTGICGGPAAAIPLLRGGDVVGVLLAVRRADRDGFSERELRFLGHTAGPVSAAIQNAQAHERLKEAQAQILADNAALERKITERTSLIARAKREWEQTFDAIREPISVQEGFIVRRANVAYAARAGVPIREVPGKTCYQLLAGRDSPCPGCPLAMGKMEPGEVQMGAFHFVLSPFRRAANPEDNWVVLHYRDVTEQKQLQVRLRESERMASLGQLASGAAHEINNPLAFVISNLRNLEREHAEVARILSSLEPLVSLAKRDPRAAGDRLASMTWDLVPQDLSEMVDESLAGASRVADIVKGLRDLSRLEIGTVEPAQVAASVSRAVRAELPDHPCVHSELAAQGRPAIPPLQLDQVLQHLLRNARQAISGTQGVRVRSWDEARQVAIEISDEGCGIPADHLPRIFEPFFTTRGVGQGVGLGLTSAYGIVQRYGGTIDVTSEPGRGTSFTVRLPRADAAVEGATDTAIH